MTSPASPNRDLLIRTARRLRPMLDEVVFIGGQMAELLLSDIGAVRLRPTIDVDIIVSVSTRSAYDKIEAQLRALGFEPDRRQGAPICRTVSRDGLVLDTMPLDQSILGFSNSWYPYAIESATNTLLEPELTIRAISAPAFLATKWEAFASRGNNDPLMSRDLEDIVMVVSGRESIVDEVQLCRQDVRSFISANAADFMNEGWAEEIVESAIREASRIPELRARILSRFNALANS
jgi:predicted nucleotidyltransferase